MESQLRFDGISRFVGIHGDEEFSTSNPTRTVGITQLEARKLEGLQGSQVGYSCSFHSLNPEP